MDSFVISDCMVDMISDRVVLAAIFTTYTFEPEFFELEVIPLLLDGKAAYSMDERVKQFMVREKLRESGIPIEVFYDSPMYRKTGNCSPQLEYLCHGVNLGNSAFHGKINILLLKDLETNKVSMLLGAGSNNISRAGWWDNIECQHWVEIENEKYTIESLSLLKEDIAYLGKYRSFTSGNNAGAFEKIESYINDLVSGDDSTDLYYYGLSYNDKNAGFTDYLMQPSGPITKFDDWNLEIISPFFADDSKNTEHEVFLAMGVKKIALFLPMDDDGNALCDEEYFEHITSEQSITWAEWNKSTSDELGLSDGGYRRLHAKLYHFYNNNQSWVFVGSVNFTHKALNDNAEAGFMARLDSIGPMLQSISNDKDIKEFKPPEEAIPGNVDETSNDCFVPEVLLCYDWARKELSGRVVSDESLSYEIEIVSAEGVSVIKPWVLDYKNSCLDNVPDLEALLHNGSFLKIRGRYLTGSSNTNFQEQQVLLQQIGWSHKPLDLPKLSASQILAIYAGMSLERRQVMLMYEKIKTLKLNSQGGELTANIDEQIGEQFFSEYAEIFNAFGKLRDILEKEVKSERYDQVDYYLTGTGVDSLTSLIKRALETEKDDLNPVAKYLILLSAKEIYQLKEFSERINVCEERKYLVSEIEILKKSGGLKLEDNSSENRRRFFEWFEEEFFRKYKAKQSVC